MKITRLTKLNTSFKTKTKTKNSHQTRNRTVSQPHHGYLEKTYNNLHNGILNSFFLRLATRQDCPHKHFIDTMYETDN